MYKGNGKLTKFIEHKLFFFLFFFGIRTLKVTKVTNEHPQKKARNGPKQH